MRLVLTLLISFFLSFSVCAKTIANIEIADTVSHSAQSSKLILNGAGIRTKFLFDIYICSLYLENKYSNAGDIYNAPGEKRISMLFLYNEVSKEKIVKGWNKGFENNLLQHELKQLKDRITRFNNFFVTARKGDTINLNFIPTTGTSIIINGQTIGLIEGDDFFVALLKIWLGAEPADDNLKKALLGTD